MMVSDSPRPGWVLRGQSWELRNGPFLAKVSPWGVCVSLQFEEWTCATGHSLSSDSTLDEKQERCEATIANMRQQMETRTTTNADGAVVGAQVTVREARCTGS
jgi:hypothetical protein